MSEETPTIDVSAEPRGGLRLRSPNYPMFDLQTAATRITAFQKKVGRNLVDIDTAMQAIGYRSKTAQGNRGIATMLSYGLLDEVKTGKGAREFKLSADGYKLAVVYLDEQDEDRIALLQQIALRPKVFSDLANRFEPPFVDSAIRKYLVGSLDFNPEAVADVIRNFKATYEFAKLEGRGTLSPDETDKEDEEDGPKGGIQKPAINRSGTGGGKVTGQTPPAVNRTLGIPMMDGRELLLQAPERPIKADIPYLELLESYIGLMKKQAALNDAQDEANSGNDD